MQNRLDPGLQVHSLWERGIDGRGVAVAVIDKPIRADHAEFGDRLTYIEVVPDHPQIKTLHYHGIAASSILAGTKAGVSPSSTIHYFAVPDVSSAKLDNYARALEMILEFNTVSEQPIEVVSVSDGFDRETQAGKRWLEAIRAAEARGIIVIHCEDSGTFPVPFIGAGSPPDRDRSDWQNFNVWFHLQTGYTPNLSDSTNANALS